jgi:hypothetical protein
VLGCVPLALYPVFPTVGVTFRVTLPGFWFVWLMVEAVGFMNVLGIEPPTKGEDA